MSGHVDNISWQEALERLRVGNELFVSESHRAPQSIDHVAHLAEFGQKPFATVITCSDSRVAPELMFHCAMGEIFTIRTAGQVMDQAVLGSAEYGAAHLGTNLIVVLGHSRCGAVAGACGPDEHEEGALGALISKIRPIVEDARKLAKDESEVACIAENLNIDRGVALLRSIPEINHSEGLKIVGAKYDVFTGVVTFMDVEE